MPVLGRITINDGATTPVAHHFDPARRDSGTSYLYEAGANGSIAARNGLTIIEKPVGLNNRTTEEKDLEILLPRTVQETINGVQQTKIIGYNKMVIKHICAAGSTEQERKNLRVMGANLLGHPTIIALLDKAEGMTG